MGIEIAGQQNHFAGGLSVELTNAPLSLDSPFYIERPPLETLAYAEIEEPGCLIRLKAPRYMGKTSLLLRMSDQSHRLGYATCTVDFLQTDSSRFSQLDTFLRWLCSMVARQLGFSPDLEDYWDQDIGSKVSCTIYFEHRLLSQVESPIVVLFNEVNRVFEYPEIAADFLSLLRFWYEQGNRSPL
jgi:hypothetical protein